MHADDACQPGGGQKRRLRLEANSIDKDGWTLVVGADGQDLLRQAIRNDGWQVVEVDLPVGTGKPLLLEVSNLAAGDEGVYGMIANLNIVQSTRRLKLQAKLRRFACQGMVMAKNQLNIKGSWCKRLRSSRTHHTKICETSFAPKSSRENGHKSHR